MTKTIYLLAILALTIPTVKENNLIANSTPVKAHPRQAEIVNIVNHIIDSPQLIGREQDQINVVKYGVQVNWGCKQSPSKCEAGINSLKQFGHRLMNHGTGDV